MQRECQTLPSYSHLNPPFPSPYPFTWQLNLVLCLFLCRVIESIQQGINVFRVWAFRINWHLYCLCGYSKDDKNNHVAYLLCCFVCVFLNLSFAEMNVPLRKPLKDGQEERRKRARGIFYFLFKCLITVLKMQCFWSVLIIFINVLLLFKMHLKNGQLKPQKCYFHILSLCISGQKFKLIGHKLYIKTLCLKTYFFKQL